MREIDAAQQSSVFSVSECYPNPFHSHASITVLLAEQSDVILEMFDAAGHEINMIHHERLTTGQHVFRFDAEMLPSGIYFLRVSKNTRNPVVRKMVLLR